MMPDDDKPYVPEASDGMGSIPGLSPSFGDWGQFSAGTQWGNKAADILSKAAYGVMEGLVTLPQRAIEGSAQDVQHLGEPGYQPQAVGPAFDTAMMTMGIGTPMAKPGTLGSAGGKLASKAWMDEAVPVDIWSSETKLNQLIPGQKVMAGPGGPVGTFKGVSPGGSVLVDWKNKAIDTTPKSESFLHSSVKAQNKFALDQDKIWRKFNDDIAAAKDTKPKTLLDTIPELKERIAGSDPETKRVSGGYTEPAYRGMRIYPGKEVSPVFDPEKAAGPMYSTADPVLADMYSSYLSTHHGPEWHPPEGAFGEGATVSPLWIDTRNYHYKDAAGAHWSEFNHKAINEAKNLGKHGVVIDNVWDEPNSTHNLPGPRKIFITFPEGLSTVKSKFATKFDPSSPNMLQGIGAIGIGGPAGYVSMVEPGQQQINQKSQGQEQQSGGMPKMSPGVMKFMMEFLKKNPDLAHEMSVRMQAVINGNQMKGGAPAQNPMRQMAQQGAPQGMPQKPPMMPTPQGPQGR